MNILENFRLNCPNAKLAYLSTNKVYGDQPNTLPIQEKKERIQWLLSLATPMQVKPRYLIA